eukprot:m.50961 g.50961  ORF g.50961 m.50961 type:complete len:178 (+) comp12187_c1_seq1:213-746(+)
MARGLHHTVPPPSHESSPTATLWLCRRCLGRLKQIPRLTPWLAGMPHVVFRKARTTRDGRMYGNALLSKHPLSDVHVVQLGAGSRLRDNGKRMPGSTERRIVLAATVKPTGRPPFLALCTHFGIFNTADGAGPAAARPGAAVSRFVNAAERRAMPALLGGDLNADPRSGVVARLKSN